MLSDFKENIQAPSERVILCADVSLDEDQAGYLIRDTLTKGRHSYEQYERPAAVLMVCKSPLGPKSLMGPIRDILDIHRLDDAYGVNVFCIQHTGSTVLHGPVYINGARQDALAVASGDAEAMARAVDFWLQRGSLEEPRPKAQTVLAIEMEAAGIATAFPPKG
jgi:hypothetical protein